MPSRKESRGDRTIDFYIVIGELVSSLPWIYQHEIHERAEGMYTRKRKTEPDLPSWHMTTDIVRDVYLSLAYYEMYGEDIETDSSFIQ